jgi:DNA invertase Pin-like site-specific DNA recombinase
MGKFCPSFLSTLPLNSINFCRKKFGKYLFIKTRRKSMAVIGYLRVSGDRQDSENQRYQLLKYANENNLRIDQWVDETISSRQSLERRQLSKVMSELKEGDTLLVSEISRLGRSMLEVMAILNNLMQKKVKVWSLKEKYRLGDDLNSKILAFAFSLAGEVERSMIAARTREALQRLRAEGKTLGRPKGSLSKKTILTGREEAIRQLLDKQVPIATAARILGVHRETLNRFVRNSL